MIKKSMVLCFLISSCFYGVCNSFDPLIITTEYGQFSIHEQMLIDLINDPCMQRLKKVHQYGPRYYLTKKEEYSRYDHSLGVFALLRRYGVPLNEQIAGLLHDVSHTVFSHVGDLLFGTVGSYQDTIHQEFINKSSLADVLQQHNIAVQDILPKNKNFLALENELPDLCADRLEYNLKGGLIEGILSQEDIDAILEALVFQDGQWVFTDVVHANKFARVSLYLTQYVWGSHENRIIYTLTCQALKRAISTGIITWNDIHYGTDDVVWKKLSESNDQELKEIMNNLMKYDEYSLSNNELGVTMKTKFRGIDPFVRVGQQILRLTTIDADFYQEFHKVKEYINQR